MDSHHTFDLVLGLGLSGRAAAEFLLRQGRRVIGFDDRRAEIDGLIQQGMLFENNPAQVNWEKVARVVVSPGVSPQHVLYQSAIEKGIPVTGEAELALPLFNKPLVAVTGTNGKTTVALLVEHILNASGIRAKALGNVGASLCAHLMRGDEADAFVVELSSFQLETMKTPVFVAAALLNITPDHLDRYRDMQEYAQAKCRLQSCLKEGAVFSVCERVKEEFEHLLFPSVCEILGWGENAQVWTDGKRIREGEKVEFLLPIGYSQLGRHDIENALAAWTLCRPFAITPDQFCRALASFCKPAHRIEFVRTVNGVDYFDDSKGTNIDAVIQAVGAMRGPVLLIAGGVDKGASYLPWKELLSGKIKEIIAIGQAAAKIYDELNPHFTIKLADSLKRAVQIAAEDGTPGDCVLLSPGCSSFDMFRNYEHRGEEFQRYVREVSTGGT